MLLSTNYYSYSFKGQQDDGTLIWNVTFNALHPIFEGHFPQNPVVPGVTMVQLVKELLTIHINKDLHLEKISLIKFLKVINPTIEQSYEVRIKLQEEGANLKCDATIAIEQDAYFKMKSSYIIL